jgi:two-component system, NarL family, nitrate/nitrite response regulator NarL
MRVGTGGTVSQIIRILLVENQTIVRAGLKLILESQSGLNVVAEASTCAEAVAAAEQSQPDVVLLDLDTDGEIGHDCLIEILRAVPQTRVLVLTGVGDLEMHYEAIYNGAMGLVRKLEPADVLLRAIRKVYADEVWLDGVLMARLLRELRSARAIQPPIEIMSNGTSHAKTDRYRDDKPRTISYKTTPEEAVKIAQLTDREREVVMLVGEGLRNQQIADRLFISVITVRHHISSVFSKLEVKDRFELAIYAYRHGLARLPL